MRSKVMSRLFLLLSVILPFTDSVQQNAHRAANLFVTVSSESQYFALERALEIIRSKSSGRINIHIHSLVGCSDWHERTPSQHFFCHDMKSLPEFPPNKTKPPELQDILPVLMHWIHTGSYHLIFIHDDSLWSLGLATLAPYFGIPVFVYHPSHSSTASLATSSVAQLHEDVILSHCAICFVPNSYAKARVYQKSRVSVDRIMVTGSLVLDSVNETMMMKSGNDDMKKLLSDLHDYKSSNHSVIFLLIEACDGDCRGRSGSGSGVDFGINQTIDFELEVLRNQYILRLRQQLHHLSYHCKGCVVVASCPSYLQHVLPPTFLRLPDTKDHSSKLKVLSLADVLVEDFVGACCTDLGVSVPSEMSLQEEASYLEVPVVVLDRSRVRWDGSKAGVVFSLKDSFHRSDSSYVSDSEGSVLTDTIIDLLERRSSPIDTVSIPSIYGDGNAGARMACAMIRHLFGSLNCSTCHCEDLEEFSIDLPPPLIPRLTDQTDPNTTAALLAVDTHISAHRLFRDSPVPGSITVVLTQYRRRHIEQQLLALRDQSIIAQVVAIYIYQNQAHEDISFVDELQHTLGLPVPVKRIHSIHKNFKFHARFAIALGFDSEYTLLLDDDVYPGEKWLEYSLNISRSTNAIVTCVGVTVSRRHEVYIFPPTNQLLEVDYGGHSWFFRTEWVRLMFECHSPSWEQAEDMMLSICAWMNGRIKTVVPEMRHGVDKSLWGEHKRDLADESKASALQPNSRELRTAILKYWIGKGWMPLEGRIARSNANEGVHGCEQSVIHGHDYWTDLFRTDIQADRVARKVYVNNSYVASDAAAMGPHNFLLYSPHMRNNILIAHKTDNVVWTYYLDLNIVKVIEMCASSKAEYVVFPVSIREDTWELKVFPQSAFPGSSLGHLSLAVTSKSVEPLTVNIAVQLRSKRFESDDYWHRQRDREVLMRYNDSIHILDFISHKEILNPNYLDERGVVSLCVHVEIIDANPLLN